MTFEEWWDTSWKVGGTKGTAHQAWETCAAEKDGEIMQLRGALKKIEPHCIDVFGEELHHCQVCKGNTLLTSDRKLHKQDCPFAILSDADNWLGQHDAEVIEQFVKRVNRAAEFAMEKTGVLEGAHYAGMQLELAAIREGEND